MMEPIYPVIDLHADTPELVLARLKGGSHTLRKSGGHIDLPRLRQGGSLVQAMAIFAPEKPLPYMPRDSTPQTIFDRTYTAYCRALEEYADEVRPVTAYEDIEQNRSEGKLSFLLTLEDGAVTGGSLEKLEELFEKGVRMIALTWNFANCFGFPNSRDPEIMGRGLTEFGREAVVRMQELGMIVDVSHLSDGGFWDVERLSKKPFIASHSDCRALCGHTRNLTDEMLRALADKGGVVGVNFCQMFLRPEPDISRIEDILRHMDHIRQVAGVEALALGSDFDGIDDVLEFGDYSGLPKLFAACEKAFTPREMDLFTHQNALRVLKECLPHR